MLKRWDFKEKWRNLLPQLSLIRISFVGEEIAIVVPTMLHFRHEWCIFHSLNCKYQSWKSNQYQNQEICSYSTSHGFSMWEREREREIWRAWIFRREKLLVLLAYILLFQFFFFFFLILVVNLFDGVDHKFWTVKDWLR